LPGDSEKINTKAAVVGSGLPYFLSQKFAPLKKQLSLQIRVYSCQFVVTSCRRELSAIPAGRGF